MMPASPSAAVTRSQIASSPSRARRQLRLLGLACALLLARTEARGGDVEINCWQAWLYDIDGDGYAHSRHEPTTFTVKNSKKLYCPSGWVKFNTDCDDLNADVHPNRSEIPFNGIDDNCSGRPGYVVGNDEGEVNRRGAIDETQLEYGGSGNGNTQTSFTMRAVINDAEILLNHANLYAEVELADLSHSADMIRLPKYKVADLSPSNAFTQVIVSGLSPTTVYRARVRFYRPVVTWAPLSLNQVGGRIPPPVRVDVVTSYVQVGGESDWYYTTTDGETQKSNVRTAILLRAFKEFDESNRGRIGYRGTVKRDGTRYGAKKKERWCSEFYAWSTKPWLRSIGTLDTVADLVHYYGVFDAFHDASEIPTMADRGDYIPMHDKTHSSAFLAFDRSTGLVWTVEGNWQNRVRIMSRDLSELSGMGHITYSMLN